MTTTYENILVDRVDGGVGIVTLNRPSVLNALNFGLVSELDAVLTDFENDADIRAVVIPGAGEKAFSAGTDIHENVDGRLARHPAGARRSTMFIAAHSDSSPTQSRAGTKNVASARGSCTRQMIIAPTPRHQRSGRLGH